MTGDRSEIHALLALLSMNVDEHLKLLEWTGRQVRIDKRDAIPADLASILARLKVSGEL